MQRSKIYKVLLATKEANTILSKAGGTMIKSSFNTAKQMATLYKDAGFKAFDLSKEVVKKTVDLALNNQKEIIRTSGAALKEVVQSIRESDVETDMKPNGRARKSRKRSVPSKKKEEITIDDLLNSSD